MAKGINKLSAVAVNKMTKAGYYGDGGGLWLQVSKSGSKSWLFRYMLHGKSHEMGLGALHTVSLAEARELALQSRKLLKDGRDPLAERKAALQALKLEQARTISFMECAAKYIDAHKQGWKNAKHLQQWESTLATYAKPYFDGLAVADIDNDLVLRCLESVWKEKPETASRLRGRIEQVLDWAKVRGYRTGENPARWKGNLDKLLPARSKVAKVEHHAAMSYKDVPQFISYLRSKQDASSRCLEFLILTATRTGEARGATWSEIDLENKLWVIPAQRMKAKAEHRVPLSERAVEILREMQAVQTCEYVFAGKKPHTPISDMAMLMLMRRNEQAFVTHGFRSSFRDWAAESTAHDNYVVEMALAHRISNQVEAAYRRGDLFEKRAKLMQDWANHCG